jgi:hypothetical protein
MLGRGCRPGWRPGRGPSRRPPPRRSVGGCPCPPWPAARHGCPPIAPRWRHGGPRRRATRHGSAAGRRRRSRTGRSPGPSGQVTRELADRDALGVQQLQRALPAVGSAATSRTRQRAQAARMACSTSTKGTRHSLLPSGASHSFTRWTCGRSATVTATRAVQSPKNDPSKPSTTSAPSGCWPRVGAARPGAIGWPRAVQGHPLAEPVAAKGVLAHLRRQGRRSASRCRKSSSAGLATSQAPLGTTAQHRHRHHRLLCRSQSAPVAAPGVGPQATLSVRASCDRLTHTRLVWRILAQRSRGTAGSRRARAGCPAGRRPLRGRGGRSGR